MIIVQIGANRGNDDLTDIIKSEKPSKFILVEPVSIHNEKLSQCYSNVENIIIDNIAIGLNESVETIKFYIHEKDGPGYEVASVDRNHVAKHYGWDYSGIKEFEVKCLTINKLFEKYNLTDVDILFIDAEGIDDLIIKTIDFKKYKINKIYFENLHITQADIYQYLTDLGYDIQYNVGHNGWCSLAYINRK